MWKRKEYDTLGAEHKNGRFPSERRYVETPAARDHSHDRERRTGQCGTVHGICHLHSGRMGPGNRSGSQSGDHESGKERPDTGTEPVGSGICGGTGNIAIKPRPAMSSHGGDNR